MNPHVIKPFNKLTPKEIEAGWGLPEYADFWGVHNKCAVNEYRGCASGTDGMCKFCKEKFDNWQAAKKRMKQPPVIEPIKRLTPKEIEQQKMELERDIQLSHDK
jgi:radical SAM superfamily enzyme with C-terminal helix-hairpin-helix motif